MEINRRGGLKEMSGGLRDTKMAYLQLSLLRL